MSRGPSVADSAAAVSSLESEQPAVSTTTDVPAAPAAEAAPTAEAVAVGVAAGVASAAAQRQRRRTLDDPDDSVLRQPVTQTTALAILASSPESSQSRPLNQAAVAETPEPLTSAATIDGQASAAARAASDVAGAHQHSEETVPISDIPPPPPTPRTSDPHLQEAQAATEGAEEQKKDAASRRIQNVAKRYVAKRLEEAETTRAIESVADFVASEALVKEFAQEQLTGQPATPAAKTPTASELDLSPEALQRATEPQQIHDAAQAQGSRRAPQGGTPVPQGATPEPAPETSQPLSSQSASVEDELAPSASSFPQARRKKDDEEEVRTESSSSPSQGPSDKMGMALGIGLMVIGIALMALAGPAGLLIGVGMMAFGAYKLSESAGSTEITSKTTKTLVDSREVGEPATVRSKQRSIEQGSPEATQQQAQQPTVSRKVTHEIPERNLRVEDHLLRIYSAIDLSKQSPEARKVYEQKISQAKELARKYYKIAGDVEIKFAEPTIQTRNRTKAEKIAAELAANLAKKYSTIEPQAAQSTQAVAPVVPVAKPVAQQPKAAARAAPAAKPVTPAQPSVPPQPGFFSRLFGSSKPLAPPDPLAKTPLMFDNPMLKAASSPSPPAPSVGGDPLPPPPAIVSPLLLAASDAVAGVTSRPSDPSVEAAAIAATAVVTQNPAAGLEKADTQTHAASGQVAAAVEAFSNPLTVATQQPAAPAKPTLLDQAAAGVTGAIAPRQSINPLMAVLGKGRLQREAERDALARQNPLATAMRGSTTVTPVRNPPVASSTPSTPKPLQRGNTNQATKEGLQNGRT